MIPVLSAEQIRSVDAHTIASEPVSSTELMERAATGCMERILAHLPALSPHASGPAPLVVFAGMGNNGGDGLVIARLLHAKGHKVRVLRVLHRTEPSADHAINLRRCEVVGVAVTDLAEKDTFPGIGDDEVIVDALLGTGLSSPAKGLPAQTIQAMNASGRPIISVDMPSGLFCEDNTANDPRSIVRATLTFTFEVPKLALLLPENAPFVGRWEVVPIGADPAFIAGLATNYHVLEQNDALELLPPRPWAGHKGTFGHALLIAGSTGRMGAAVLATRSALRSGCGLVTARIPRDGLFILQTSAPEVMAAPDPLPDHVSELPKLDAFQAIGIGPGLEVNDDTSLLIKRLIQDVQVPLVLDADALNILAANPTWQAFLPQGSILTPHPKEFDRLVGERIGSGSERLARARAMAMQRGVIVVLKGAPTAIFSPDGQVRFNSTGNPGMAKGGSGDALTGLLTGLLAQGMPPLAASLFGVYLHGLAGDHAARARGMDGMTTGDLIEALPEAWRSLRDPLEQVLH